jgi:hypothetical protein
MDALRDLPLVCIGDRLRNIGIRSGNNAQDMERSADLEAFSRVDDIMLREHYEVKTMTIA